MKEVYVNKEPAIFLTMKTKSGLERIFVYWQFNGDLEDNLATIEEAKERYPNHVWMPAVEVTEEHFKYLTEE